MREANFDLHHLADPLDSAPQCALDFCCSRERRGGHVDKMIVVGIWDAPDIEDRVSVHATVNVADMLERASREPFAFLPVGVFEADTDLLKKVMNWTGLPHRMSMPSAAALFHSTKICDNAWSAVLAHLNRLGSRATPLLIEWQRAVKTALEVAA